MIEYRTTAKGLQPSQLAGFFEGWPNPPGPDAHLAILKASAEVVLAVDTERERVVGFITALTDGVLAAYVPLLEVLPDHRGHGLGRELVRRILARLDGLYMVDVVCDPSVQPFYESLGFTRTVGASLRRYEHQAGRPR